MELIFQIQEFIIAYGSIYLLMQFIYGILYSFLLGFNQREINNYILYHGFLFPLSLQNELGALTALLIIKIREKRSLKNEKKK